MSLLFVLVVLAAFLPLALSWKCIPIQTKQLHDGVLWKTQNCTMDEDAEPHLTVNSIHIDISRSDLRVIPAIADPVAQVQSLPDMATQNPNFIAGINGGYFWRVDMDGFWRDNVCHGKVRKEAEQPANPLVPNFGIGDGAIKIDGKVLASNCNCSGYSRPAVLKLQEHNSSIEVLYRGESVAHTVPSAIGAGPNLVSYNSETGESYVDIPADDDNINRLVYEATTAVGLSRYSIDGSAKSNTPTMGNTIVMVTTDGSDSCMPKDDYCGLVAPNLASLMLEVQSVLFFVPYYSL
jgi:hypothetical protein